MIEELYCLNEQGKRKNIEDCLYPYTGKAKRTDRVFLVCDGVGGEEKGEIASRLVCETMGQGLTGVNFFSREVIEHHASLAVDKLIKYAEGHPEAGKMSTTVTVACLGKEGIWVGWCGDSRIYHIRDGRVHWKSKDHSFVQSLVNINQITEEEARRHEKRNIILRSFSAQSSKAELELHQLTDIRSGDYLLLCTDGLLEQMTDALICQVLTKKNDIRDKAALFNRHCQGKTGDNYSMYLMRLNYKSTGSKSARQPGRNWAAGKLLMAILFMLVLVGAGYFFTMSYLGQSKTKPAIQEPLPAPSQLSIPEILPALDTKIDSVKQNGKRIGQEKK